MEFDPNKMSLGEITISENPGNHVSKKSVEAVSGDSASEINSTSSNVSESETASTASGSTAHKNPEGTHNSPTVIILVGMAGSGKTTLAQRLTAHLHARNTPPYTVNLDPACREPPFPVNIDIRDTVDYKKVMKQYNLGPNGAIVTSLNLFATKFDQVIQILKQRSKSHKYILIDTPGQIEVFMWSASGNIITECLGALFPTVMIYVTDLVTNANPVTFMSNMSYACSILYKTKLPLIVTLNKCDQIDATYAKEWITDLDAFQEALQTREEYSCNLASSLSLVLDDFYKHIEHSVVSAFDGFGIDEFFDSVSKAVVSYETLYKPMYEELVEKRMQQQTKQEKGKQNKLSRDLTTDSSLSSSARGFSDGGAGLSLRLDTAADDDEVSSEEDVPKADSDDEDESFGQMFKNESKKRIDKSGEPPNPAP